MDAHLTTIVATELIESRIREATAARAARDARPQAGFGGARLHAAGLRRTLAGARTFGRVTASRR